LGQWDESRNSAAVIGDGYLCAVAHLGEIAAEMITQFPHSSFHDDQYGALSIENLARIRTSGHQRERLSPRQWRLANRRDLGVSRPA
jgi:hypothetical protein